MGVGVVSFSLAMIGCLVLFLIPADRNLPIQLPAPPPAEKATEKATLIAIRLVLVAIRPVLAENSGGRSLTKLG